MRAILRLSLRELGSSATRLLFATSLLFLLWFAIPLSLDEPMNSFPDFIAQVTRACFF